MASSEILWLDMAFGSLSGEKLSTGNNENVCKLQTF